MLHRHKVYSIKLTICSIVYKPFASPPAHIFDKTYTWVYKITNATKNILMILLLCSNVQSTHLLYSCEIESYGT